MDDFGTRSRATAFLCRIPIFFLSQNGGTWTFYYPFFIILTVAVGGTWPGLFFCALCASAFKLFVGTFIAEGNQ
jgi:hypothetical protein